MLKAPHRPERRALSEEIFESGAVIKSEYGVTRVQCLERDIMRVTFFRGEETQAEESPFVIDRSTAKAKSVSKADDCILITNGSLRARLSTLDGTFSAEDLLGRPVFSEDGLKTMEAYIARRVTRGAEAQTETVETADGVKTVVRDAPRDEYKRLYRARLPLSFRPEEALYGLGQPESGPANLRGRKLYLCQANRSIALPFFVSTGGYGLLIDCGCPFIFNDTPEGSYLYFSGVEKLDYYIIPGTCEQAVRGYHYLTGRPALLPAWAYGYWQSQERYETADEMIRLAEGYRKAGIGLDCAVLDWCSWPDGQWGQKGFDPIRFPNPDALTKRLHDMDVRMMISIWPNMNPRSPQNDEFKQRNLLLPGGELYDALDPEARRLYWKQTKEGLFDHGLDAWWCDSSEPWTSEWSHQEKPEDEDMYQETLSMASDAIGTDNGCAYPFYHAMTMWEGQRSERGTKRVVNLTRSAWAGQQRYGTVLWSGDISAKWDTLKKQIAVGLDMSASGMPWWTQDIGAFFVKRGAPWYWDGDYEDGWNDPEYRELFVRWYQYAAFLPVFRGHGTDIRRELTNLKGEEYEAALKYNRARYQLLPYIYSAAGLTARHGGLIMKPLGFEFPDDEAARGTSDEYLFCNTILVCPVTEYKARKRKVYLPQGMWYEMATGKRICGPMVYEAEAPLDVLPLFVKAGSVIPAVDTSVCAREAMSKEPVMWVFPGADGKLDWYRDAGDGYGYENGEYTVETYVWNDKNRSLLKGKGENVPFRVFGE
ncbi:MAG: glycoside hydrolase [Clostridia bacterium]|nr:glycoside hydrolase [Clostridia bacterium]